MYISHFRRLGEGTGRRAVGTTTGHERILPTPLLLNQYRFVNGCRSRSKRLLSRLRLACCVTPAGQPPSQCLLVGSRFQEGAFMELMC